MPSLNTNHQLLSFSNWQHLRLKWYRCNRILRLLYVRAELEDLIAWAQRKRLMNTVGNAYRRKLIQREHELSVLTFRYPYTATWATILYWINRLVSGETPHYKGYAAKYRHNFKKLDLSI